MSCYFPKRAQASAASFRVNGPDNIVEVVYLRRDRSCRRILVVALRNAAFNSRRHGDTITVGAASRIPVHPA